MYLWISRILFVYTIFCPLIANAADPSEDWKTLHTEHFLIHHLASYSDHAKRTAIISERSYRHLQKKLSWTPEEKINILITDEHDIANGSASPYPFNLAILRLYPPDEAGSLEDYDDWLSLLIEHELTHIFHTDKSTGASNRLRKVFGRHILLFPNILQPAWLIEGLATYYETHKGIGRGQSSGFEMRMREEVNKGLLPVSTVNLPPDSQPLGRHYLYGVYFYQFLQKKYGEHVIKLLIDNYSNNLLPFAINSNSKGILRKDITQLWNEYKHYLKKRFDAQIELLSNSKLNEGSPVSDELISLTSLDSDTSNALYFIDDKLESGTHLVKLVAGKKDKLIELNRFSQFDLGSDNNIYISQIDYCDQHHLYYDLYRFNLKTKKLKQLTECARYKRFSVSKTTNNIVAVSINNSIPQIDLLNSDGQLIRTLWQGEYGDVINHIDWSEKRNKLLLSKKELNKSWSIQELDLVTNKLEPLVSNKAENMHGRYTSDSSEFMYISDKTGVFNVYKYSFLTGNNQALSNVLTGAFSPYQINKDEFYYLNFERDGYRLHSSNTKNTKAFKLKEIEGFEPRYMENQLDDLTELHITDYNVWSDLKPRYWFPYFAFVDESSEVGFSTSSNDSLQNHFYELIFIYGISQEEVLGSLFYSYSNWFNFITSKQNIVYTNTNTNLTDLIRENTQFQTLFSLPFIKLKKQWDITLGLVGYAEKDAYRASGILANSSVDDKIMGLSFYFNNKQSFLKGNSPESGRDVSLVAENSDAFKSDYAGQLTTVEWREFFQLGNHYSLAFRYVAGHGDNTMRSFRLGGTKTELNAVSITNSNSARKVFNIRNYALRGYAENTQTGHNIEMATLEWRFPLMHVEKGIMAPPLGIIKHSGSLFTEAGASWDSGQQKNIISSVGAEWLMQTNLFYNLNLQMRFGIAKGLDQSGDEFYYFRVGRSF